MTLAWRIGSYALAIAAFVAAASWYGHSKYQAGYDKADLEAEAAAALISEQYRKEELEAAKAAKEANEKYQAEQAKTAAARDRLANLYSSMRDDYAAYKRAVSEAGIDPGKAARVAKAGIENLERCTARYTSMAEEYAGRADDHNALIEQCKIGR